MKIVIFFLFSFISYVFAGTPGPLGLAAKMPPYRPEGKGLRLGRDSLSDSFTLKETLLHMSKGTSGRDCLQHFLSVCEDLKKTYNKSSDSSFLLDIVCEDSERACITYEDVIKGGPLNSTICAGLYSRCRLRSSGCSSKYADKCQTLSSRCHHHYGLYDIFSTILEHIGFDLDSPRFDRKLRRLCRGLSDTSETFVQLCLYPDLLKEKLKDFIKFRSEQKGDFLLYPRLDAGALVKSVGLDGDLFSPGTQDGTDPLFLLGYLVSQSSSTSFVDACKEVTRKCLGLSFFPQTAHFCEINSHETSTICQEAHVELTRAISNLKKDLSENLPNGDVHRGHLTGGVDSDLCKNYLVNCSYLGGLDSELSDLCGFLRDYCSYALEIGSALSIFDYYFYKYNKGNNFDLKLKECEANLYDICHSLAETTVDFFLFCYKPGHTCTALRTLNTLRCEKYKNRFSEYYLTKKLCVDTVYEYEPYMHRCGDYENFVYFFNKCLKKFPGNDYLEDFSTKLKESSNLENEDSETDDEDDGF
ncbi:hypothetical protein MERGE_000610 [Pneumocystis wakefieldiae]|uniref:Uncharacterized protein n=1 Tax=Pneumocystis wakefieldiae TaxID=38082 RepID=A0A899G0U1_9ASCO|nr:hypothetical protein MERGE_000610 [Pneumocystis wakefieldiae]